MTTYAAWSRAPARPHRRPVLFSHNAIAPRALPRSSEQPRANAARWQVVAQLRRANASQPASQRAMGESGHYLSFPTISRNSRLHLAIIWLFRRFSSGASAIRKNGPETCLVDWSLLHAVFAQLRQNRRKSEFFAIRCLFGQ